jgi:AraC-like DNA-binding protein/ligand-binding sensor protein
MKNKLALYNLKMLKKLRELITEFMDVYIVFLDTEGNFITPDIGKRKFCLKIAEFKLNNYCDKSNFVWTKKCVNNNQPYVYKCPFGLTEIITPIVVNKKVIGVILAGQIRSSQKDSFILPKDVNITSDKFFKLRELYKEIPVVNYEKIIALKDFMLYILNYIIETNFEIIMKSKMSKDILHIVEEVKKFIDKNFCKKIDIQQLAQKFDIPMYYLTHMFHEVVGRSISNYINNKRLNYSIQLLKDPSYTIKQIVSICGFNDQHYFNKMFKKEFGITPGQFRKKLVSK